MTSHSCPPPALPCSVALPQQAALTLILLLGNGQLCQCNTAIQLAYSRLAARAGLQWARLPVLLQHAQRVLHFSPEMHSCGASVLAAPARAAEAVRAACMIATRTAAVAAVPSFDALPGATGTSASGEQLCLQYQPAR